MLYLVSQFQVQKNELSKLQIPKEILNRLWSQTLNSIIKAFFVKYILLFK